MGHQELSRRQRFMGLLPLLSSLILFSPPSATFSKPWRMLHRWSSSGQSVRQSLQYFTHHVSKIGGRVSDLQNKCCDLNRVSVIFQKFRDFKLWSSRGDYFFRFYFYLRACLLAHTYGDLIWWLLLAFVGIRHTHGSHTYMQPKHSHTKNKNKS